MALTLTDRTGRVVASCASPAALAAAARLLGLAILDTVTVHDQVLGRLTTQRPTPPASS